MKFKRHLAAPIPVKASVCIRNDKAGCLLVAAAILLTLSSCDGTQPDTGGEGRVVKDGRELTDNREVLSPPILDDPIYECTEGVWVSGFKPGAQIDIFLAGTTAPIGTGTSQFTSGDKFKVSVTFKKGMVITAKQTKDGFTSGPSNAVTVRHPKDDYPGGWPKPRIDPPPVYKCGRAIGSRDQLNGSTLTVLQEKRRPDGTFEPAASIGSVGNARGWDYAITSPFEMDARVRVRYRLCEEDSPLSDVEIVQPPPAIPAPTIDQGYENQQIVVVRNTVNGANLEVFANAVAPANRVGGQPTAVSWGQQILVTPSASPLIATAALCDPPTVGPPMIPKPCSELPPAKIKQPAPGDDYVEVIESVPGANIRIYVGTEEIGDGGGNPMKLTRKVQEGEVLRVVQSLGDCTSQWVFEIPVGCSRAGDPGACRADWPAFGHDSTRGAQQPKLSSLSDPFRARTLKVKWRFPSTGSLNRFRSSPIVYKGIVYTGNADGRFYAVDAATGKEIWRYPPSGQPALTSRYADPGIGRVNDSSRGLASSGVIARIRKEVDAVIFGGPDRSIPPGLGSGRLFALNAQTGAEIWKSDAVAVLNGTPESDNFSELHEQIGYSSPVVIGDRVYIGIADHADSPIQNGKVVAVELNTGAIIGAFKYVSTSDRGGGIWSAPAGGPNGELYVTTGNTNIGRPKPAVNHGLSLLRLDGGNGNVMWELQPVPFELDGDPDWASGPQSAKTACGSVVASTMKDGWAYAVNANSSAPPAAGVIWQFPPTGFPFNSEPPIHGDTRYLVPGAIWEDVFVTMTGGVRIATTTLDGFNKLHGLNICGNKQDPVRWLFDVPNTTANSPYQQGPPTGTRGIFFVGTEQGRLIVFADPAVVPHAGLRCTNPTLSNPDCVPNGGRLVPNPWVIANIPLSAGGIRTQPALADGRVFVATLGGVLFMLEP